VQPGRPLVTQPPILVMGPDQNFLTRVRLGQPFMVWVWLWKISPKNIKFFNFFLFGSKKYLRVRSEIRVEGGLASYLLRVKSKLKSGRVRAHLYPIPPLNKISNIPLATFVVFRWCGAYVPNLRSLAMKLWEEIEVTSGRTADIQTTPPTPIYARGKILV